MDRPSLYENDIVTWAEEQAASLRALGARPDLADALDWENVAEEIESLGQSELRAVENLLAQVLAQLLRQLSVPAVRNSLHWREETRTFHSAARLRYEASMHHRIRWYQVWELAKAMADCGLSAYGDALLPRLPETCPISLDEMLAESLDLNAALLRLAEVARSN